MMTRNFVSTGVASLDNVTQNGCLISLQNEEPALRVVFHQPHFSGFIIYRVFPEPSITTLSLRQRTLKD